MTEKMYVIRFEPPESSTQRVVAATAEIVDDYLVLLHGDGTVSALFLADVVGGWSCEPTAS